MKLALEKDICETICNSNGISPFVVTLHADVIVTFRCAFTFIAIQCGSGQFDVILDMAIVSLYLLCVCVANGLLH